MPGFDRTGPAGGGPMTGRQLGRCAGNMRNLQGRGARYGSRGLRRGYRIFGGRGSGFRWGNPVIRHEGNFIPESDETILENEARSLKDQLSRIENELERIRKSSKQE